VLRDPCNSSALTAAIDLIDLTNASRSGHPDGSRPTSCDDREPQNYGGGVGSPEILIQASIICLKDFWSLEAMPGLDMSEFHADSCTVNRLYSVWMVSSASAAVVPNVDM
jgi:hypothetical protein